MNKFWGAVAVLAVIGGMLVVFAPMTDLQNQLDTDIVTPITDNLTAYTAVGAATVPSFNTPLHLLYGNLWWIIALVIIIVLVIAIGRIGGSNG